jgi:hypothetical protein
MPMSPSAQCRRRRCQISILATVELKWNLPALPATAGRGGPCADGFLDLSQPRRGSLAPPALHPPDQPDGLASVAITAYWQHVVFDDRASSVDTW